MSADVWSMSAWIIAFPSKVSKVGAGMPPMSNWNLPQGEQMQYPEASFGVWTFGIYCADFFQMFVLLGSLFQRRLGCPGGYS